MSVEINKTAIIEYVSFRVLLRLRSASRNLRTKVNSFIEGKKVIIRKFDEKALNLSKWVQIGFDGIPIKSEIQKGISNYLVKSQEDLDQINNKNESLRCFLQLSESINKTEIEFTPNLVINSYNFALYSNISFQRIQKLELIELETEQIKTILVNIKEVKRIYVNKCNLDQISLSSVISDQIFFEKVVFSGKVSLPSKCNSLRIEKCKNICLVEPSKTRKLIVEDYEEEGEKLKEWFKTFDSALNISFFTETPNIIEIFPLNTRKICLDEPFRSKIEIKREFPLLRQVNNKISVSDVEKLKIKEIRNELVDDCKTRVSAEIRKVYIKNVNYRTIQKHPELLEKATCIDIWTSRFNLDFLPKNLDRIVIRAINMESIGLN